MNSYRKHYGVEGSHRYVERLKPNKQRAEMQLVLRAMTLVSRDDKILDIPCGGGRILLGLARKGYDVDGADVSGEMVNIARRALGDEKLDNSVYQEDLERLNFPDMSYDDTICFRLFHHLPNPGLRTQIVGELCRITRKRVLLSYHSPWSYGSLNRKLSSAIVGKQPTRWTISLNELQGYFDAYGFRLERDFARTPVLRTLHLGVWKRSFRA